MFKNIQNTQDLYLSELSERGYKQQVKISIQLIRMIHGNHVNVSPQVIINFLDIMVEGRALILDICFSFYFKVTTK